jgi:sec-independent protein translocase protein TatB
MFDLAWSEIALIGVVALIAIGPKDMPVAIKAVAEMVKKARRMASEFQTHVDEMVREANLHEVRDHINDIRSMDIKGKILNAVDNDGSLRRTINERPYNASPPPVTPVIPVDASTPPHEPPAIAASDPAAAAVASEAVPAEAAAPAYIDPRGAPPASPAQHEPATHPTPHA